jgi:hypothetical protein
MSNQVGLIPLRCVHCDTPVSANSDEVAWVCQNCGQGLLLDTSKGLVPLTVHYSKPVESASNGMPFWVSQGQVNLVRTPHGSPSKKIVDEVENYWRQGRLFFIPAYSLLLEQFLSQAIQFINSPPGLKDGSPFDFLPVILAPEDLKKIAEVIVMAIEVQRKDQLHQLRISVELAPPDLWILP